ncbi:MAG: hypothetical protein ACHQDD_01250 [Steroidobacterales bacterium]
MKPRANPASRLAFSLFGLGALAWLSLACAQTPPPAPAAASSAAEVPDPPAYQDRYIDGGSLRPDISAGDIDAGDSQGLARSLQIDGVLSMLSSNDSGSSRNVVEDGVIVKSQWETAAYGAWSFDASARTGGHDPGYSEQGQGGVVTLQQRAMPFDGDWQADNGLGDLNSPDISMARAQPRFYLPTGPMQGVTTEWRGPSGLQVVAGGGVPGIYDGIEVPDFRTLDGSTATVGAQWSPAPPWTLGAQVIDAHDVNLFIGPAVDGAALMSSTTGLLSSAWQDNGARVQLNVLDGAISGKGNGFGSWIDASIVQGRVLQNAGVFRIDPNLTWGNQLISNDMQGGYYRFNYQSRQWLADVGIDEVRSVSGLGSNTTFLTGDTRYQLSRDWGVGSVANISLANGSTSWSLEGYVDHTNDWGTGRAQTDFTTTPTGQTADFALDQTWSTPTGIRLSTSASVERLSGAIFNGAQQDSTMLNLAVYGGGQFTTRLGIEGNVLWGTAVQGRAAPGVSANISLTWQLSRSWEILATYYDSQVGSWTPLSVVSPLTPPVATPIPAVQERGVFLTIRYQRSAGSHFAPLGGPPGSGSGELAGIVYLDANDNGQFDAGEAGAPNVTVVLDGRFSVQTDASGSFDFPVVATGHHIISVIADNLPLPWVLINQGRSEAEVTTRGRTEISIAARRPR